MKNPSSADDFPDRVPSNGVREQDRPCMEEMLEWLEAFVASNLARSPNLKQLALKANISLHELNQAVSRSRGMSLARWVKGLRLDAARHMLLDEHENKSIKDIAVQTGFSSPSAFSHSYFCHFGELPSETRKVRKDRA